MKDKKCTDFVFMPLRDGATPRAKGEGGSKVSSSAVSESDSLAPGPATEVRSKIVIVGACCCGKTALIHRYIKSTFLEVSFYLPFSTYVLV